MDEKQMSEQNPYTTLEVGETASFEEIQGARDRLVQQNQSDERSRQVIEAAYDAVLMDRLRKRQEGKVTVPDRIRLAEDLPTPTSKLSLSAFRESPRWLQQLFDKPSGSELLTTAIPFGVAAIFCLLNQFVFNPAPTRLPGNSTLTMAIAFGIGFCLYWLNRKEQRLGRAVVITLLTLILGGLITALLLQLHMPLSGLHVDTALTVIVLSLFWLACSFLR